MHNDFARGANVFIFKLTRLSFIYLFILSFIAHSPKVNGSQAGLYTHLKEKQKVYGYGQTNLAL